MCRPARPLVERLPQWGRRHVGAQEERDRLVHELREWRMPRIVDPRGGQILWPEQDRVALLSAAAAALQPGGRVLVYDPILDETAPALNTVPASLNMLVWSAAGSEYTVRQLVRWFAKAGLSYSEHQRLAAGSTVVLARKRG